ncbi:EZH inhibitory protein isoform 2-T2 [Hipposideros larvatus]
MGNSRFTPGTAVSGGGGVGVWSTRAVSGPEGARLPAVQAERSHVTSSSPIRSGDSSGPAHPRTPPAPAPPRLRPEWRSPVSEGELGIMATRSGWEKELKQQEGGGAIRFCTASDSTCAVAAPGAILVIAEDPGSPSMDSLQARGRPALQGSQSPLAELRRVGPEAGQSLQNVPTESAGATGQATSGAGQLRGRPAQTRSPAKGRGQKRSSGVEAAGAPKRSRRCLFVEAPAPEASANLPPSSPTAQPSSHCRRPAPRAGPCVRASQPGPALQSQGLLSTPGHALGSQASGPCPALRSRTSPPGRASRRRETSPGPAPRRREAAPGPAPRRREAAPGPAPRRREAAPGPAPRRREAAPGRASRRREAAPDRASRRRSSAPASAFRRCSSEPGPASRSGAIGPGPAVCSPATRLSPALHSGGTTPGFVGVSRPILRGSSPTSHPSLPGPGGQSPPFSGSPLGRRVMESSSGSPDPEVPSLPFNPCWHAVRMRASSPSPPGRDFPLPGRSEWSSSSSSSPPTNSGQRSSSPEFSDPGSVSTPSPGTIGRALLLEFAALSPVSP